MMFTPHDPTPVAFSAQAKEQAARNIDATTTGGVGRHAQYGEPITTTLAREALAGCRRD